MPLDISEVEPGKPILAEQNTQYFDVLTGVMTDQNVNLAGPKNYFNGIGCRVYNTSPATSTITTSLTTLVTFNTDRFDDDNIHSILSNTSQLVCRTAGSYQISVFASWAASATGIRRVFIRHNGSTTISGQGPDAGDAALSTYQSPSTLWDMAVNDYVELLCIQSSGGDLAGTFEFMMVKVG